MGKKRLAVVDATTPSAPQKPEKKTEVKPEPKTEPTQPQAKPVKVRVSHQRSRKYRLALTKVNRDQTYSLDEAVELAKQVSLTSFPGKLEAHLNLTEANLRVPINFPHSTGRKIRVAIATAELLKDVTQGQINFDVLLASPQIMPQVAKVAKILGPKGLMPNPKNGTVTQDPDKKKAELESGQVLAVAEAKAPLMHLVLGQLSQPDQELVANLQALIAAVTPTKITKLTLSPTMGPGIKVNLAEFTQTVVK